MRSARADAATRPQLAPYLRAHGAGAAATATIRARSRWRGNGGSEAGDDDAAIVRRALAWISANSPTRWKRRRWGRHAVDEFLFDDKAGYLRALQFVVRGADARRRHPGAGGRPAMPAATATRIGDYWLVRRSDAHAWAEVWLPRPRLGAGGSDRRGGARAHLRHPGRPRAPAGEPARRRRHAGAANVGDWLRRGWNDLVLGFDASRQQQLLRPLGIDELDAAAAGRCCSRWSPCWPCCGWSGCSARGQREPDPVLRAWHGSARRYRRLGLEREPHETAARLGRARRPRAS